MMIEEKYELGGPTPIDEVNVLNWQTVLYHRKEKRKENEKGSHT